MFVIEDNLGKGMLKSDTEDSTINHKLAIALKSIWENNDLEAVEYFRLQVKEGKIALYRKDQEDFSYEPLFFHGEPILHKYSLSPLPYKLEIKQLISLIAKNDEIGFEVANVEQDPDSLDHPHIDIHIRSGLVRKKIGNKVFLFPQVIQRGIDSAIVVGDIVKYTTAVDQRNHYGEVISIQQNMILIKEYAGFCFSHDRCEFIYQDRGAWWHQEHVVCVPVTSCSLLAKDDYRIEEMRNASVIRNLWKRPNAQALNELRRWFCEKSANTTVYYLECENNNDLSECPYLYTIKELADREAAKRTSETIRQITLPESCSEDYAYVIPNTDEADEEMGIKVSYINRNWSVIKISISDIVSKFQVDSYRFQVDGLFDFYGDAIISCSVVYSPVTGTVSTYYRDLEGVIEKNYLQTLDIGNRCIPQVGSIITYCGRSCSQPAIAKVTAISADLVRVATWEGITYKKEQIDTRSPDNWTSISNTFIPISSCKLIPDVSLSSEQLNSILRFEDENELIRAPWGKFCRPKKKLPFDVNSIICGLENLRLSMPEMFVGWIRFISSDYLTDIAPEVLNMAKKYVSWIDSTKQKYDGFGDSIEDINGGPFFDDQLDKGEIDFVGLIDEMSIAIEKVYFPETDELP